MVCRHGCLALVLAVLLPGSALAGQTPSPGGAGSAFTFSGPPPPMAPEVIARDAQGRTTQAARRLEPIQAWEELGSGFYLAMHDLEIRGAGEVLGEHQSGNMMEVGFQLYNEMLSEAVRALKAGGRWWIRPKTRGKTA